MAVASQLVQEQQRHQWGMGGGGMRSIGRRRASRRCGDKGSRDWGEGGRGDGREAGAGKAWVSISSLQEDSWPMESHGEA